jgi:hypothetical protein
MDDETASPIRITYRGDAAAVEARRVYDLVEKSVTEIKPPSEITATDVRLGAAEVIITIVVTGALKAVAETSLQHLESYLRSRARARDTDVKMQVVLTAPNAAVPKRFPINLRELSIEMLATFFEKIRSAIDKM